MANRKELKRRAQFENLGQTSVYGGVPTTLFPNDEEGEIWVSDGAIGFAVRFSKGSRGISVNVRSFAGGSPLTCNGVEAREFTVTQFRSDAKTQAFKKWYALDAESPLDDELTNIQRTMVKKMYDLGRIHAEDVTVTEPVSEAQDEIYRKAYERGFWSKRADL